MICALRSASNLLSSTEELRLMLVKVDEVDTDSFSIPEQTLPARVQRAAKEG